MKLPNKKPEQSLNMSSAMRDPVLRGNDWVRSQAAIETQQRMPTDYNRVGTAQGNAALAQGKIGLSLGNAALKVSDAIQKVNLIQQKVTYTSKATELDLWLGEYLGNLSGEDLSAWNGDKGKYEHEIAKDKFNSAYRIKKAEMDKMYKITNGNLQQQWKDAARGAVGAARVRIDEYARSGQDKLTRTRLLAMLPNIQDHEGKTQWVGQAMSVFSEEFVANKIIDIGDQIQMKLARKVFDSQAGDSNINLQAVLIDAIRENKVGPDGQQALSDAGLVKIEEAVDKKMRRNRASAMDGIRNAASSIAVHEAWGLARERIKETDVYDPSTPTQVSSEDEEKLWAAASSKISELIVEEKWASMTDEYGRVRDDPASTSRILVSIGNDSEVTDADKIKAETKIVDASKHLWKGRIQKAYRAGRSDKGGPADILMEMLGNSSPEALGLDPDDIENQAVILRDAAAYLQGLKDSTNNLYAVFSTDAKKRQLASRKVNGTAPTSKEDDLGYAEYMWEDYVKKQMGESSGNPADNPELTTLLQKFTNTFRMVPPSIIDDLQMRARGEEETSTPQSRISAMMALVTLDRNSNNILQSQKGVDTELLNFSIRMVNSMQGFSPESQAEILKNASGSLINQPGLNPLLDERWKAVSSNKSETIANRFKIIAARSQYPVDELGEAGTALVNAYLKDAFYNLTSMDLAIDSAVGLAMTRLGFEGGEYKIDSIYARHKYATIDRSDQYDSNGFNPVRKTVDEIVRLTGLEKDEIYFKYLEKEDAFVGINVNTGNIISIETPVIGEDGKPSIDVSGNQVFQVNQLIFKSDQLMGDGQADVDKGSTTEELNLAQVADDEVVDLLRGLDTTPNEFGQYSHGSQSAAIDLTSANDSRRDLEREESLSIAVTSDDPMISGMAERELQVITSGMWLAADEDTRESIMKTQLQAKKRLIEAIQAEKLRQSGTLEGVIDDMAELDLSA